MTDVPLPDMPPGPSPEEILLAGLRKRFLELAVRAHEIESEAKVIKERMRKLGRGQHAVGDGKITISPNNRFDPGLAEKVLSEINPDLVAACSVSKIESSLVKKLVGDDVYERCQKAAGDDKVSIL
jgi:hypothetical protein